MSEVGLRSPAQEFKGPPRAWYMGDDWLQRDIEAVFRPRWLVAGHVDELDQLGTYGYLTFSLGDEEALIRRDERGELRAFQNFCPHRGSQLCVGRSGTAPTKRIVCPYHQWTFSVSDGSLLNAREMHEDFDPRWYGLKPVHVDEHRGLIFLCFDDGPVEPVIEYMAKADWGGYDFSSMKLAATKTHQIRANWKTVVENNLECYHCGVNHPEFMEIFDWRTTAVQSFDEAVASRTSGQEVEVVVSSVKVCNRVCEVPAPRGDGPEAGNPLATVIASWEPGAFMVMRYDYAWIFVPRPVAPDHTELRQYWLVSEHAQEGRDYDREQLTSTMDKTMQQDLELCERVQRGMRNTSYSPGPLNRIYQTGQAGFYMWYIERMRSMFPEVVLGEGF